MKSKGFTLIELLAIIVLLAIIALIAIPMISKIIDKTEISAAIRGAELYIDTVNQAITRENLSNKFRPKECIIQEDGNLICDGDRNLKIETTGTRPRSGILKIENRKVVSFEKVILDLYELKMDTGKDIEVVRTLENEFDYGIVDFGKDTSKASKPQLFDGLTPVVYYKGKWTVVSPSTTWYNYDDQQWANAVVLKDGVSDKIGSTVDLDKDVQGMFVWVPRYEYKIDGVYGKLNDNINVSSIQDDKSYPWELSNGIYKSSTQSRNSTTTSLKFNFTFSSKDTLSFDWSASTEACCDYIYYTITKDGTALSDTGVSTKIGGTTLGSSESTITYENITRELEPGTYELTFTYVKDGSQSAGTDTGYVKDLNIGGLGPSIPGEIEVNFVDEKTTTPSEGYRVHPAFTFGDTNLSGIWVGKFETSGTANAPTILPNVESLRGQNVSGQFTTAQKFNDYVQNADAHMLKNVDWGAVSYLSQSKYGKYGNSDYIGADKEVMVNNCSNYITGVGADSRDDVSSTSTCTTNTYETIKGQAASTTGNIYGIYDMSGIGWEYVMGNYNNTLVSSGFATMPDAKYYDKYTTTVANTACNNQVCYGHALSETRGWYKDQAAFISSASPWMSRGGHHDNMASAGMFHYSLFDGSANGGAAFRIVVTEK